MNYLKSLLLSLVIVLSSLGAFASDYTPSECPVVGNTNSRIYHVAGGQFYSMMLVKNHGSDNRECFRSESEATRAGYRKSKR